MAGLHFQVSADDSQFQQRMTAVRNSVTQTSRVIKKEGDEIDTLMSKLAKGAASIGAGMSVASFVKQLISIRGETQKLEVAFKTMLGSKEASDAMMSEAVRLAAITPFDLQGVASGYKQLLAYGFAMEDVTETMTRLGNVAAGLSIPLNDLVYLYGTTRAQGRLYTQDLNQFTGRGIPMIAELAKQFGVAESEVKGLVEAGKVGFPEVQKVIESLTNSGGMFYNLMEEQSKTLSGQISNLEDSISQMFNEIGQQTEGVLSDAISAVSYLIEHYEQIGKVLVSVVSAYGLYRGALIATAALQKTKYMAETIKAFFDLTKGLSAARKAQEAFNIAALKNPYLMIAAALLAVGTAIWQFAHNTEEATRELGELEQAINSEQKEVNSLIAKLGDANTSEDERRKIIEELNRISPENFKNINAEKNAVNDLTAALNDYNASAAKRAVVAAKQDKLNTLKEEKLTIDTNKASLQNDIMNAYQQVIQNFDDIKVRDNSIWKQVIDIDESKFDEFKERLQSLMLDSTIPFEAKMTKIYELLQTGEYDNYGESLKYSSKELDKLIALEREYWNETLNASAKEREIAAAERDIDVTKSNLNIDSSNLAVQEEEVKNYQNINTLIDEQRAKIKALNSEIKALRSGKSQSENILLDIEDKEKELQEAKKTLETLTGQKNVKSKSAEFRYISDEQDNAEELQRNNTRQQLQQEAEIAKVRKDGLDDYYKIMRMLEDDDYRHQIELIEKRREKVLEQAKKDNATSEQREQINAAFDTQIQAETQKHEMNVENLDTRQQTERNKQQLAAWQDFTNQYVRIAQERADRLEEIKKQEEEQDKKGRKRTIAPEQFEKARQEADTIADTDTATLMASLGISTEDMTLELMNIVNSAIAQGLDQIALQMPAITAELEKLRNDPDADPKQVARAEAGVKGLASALEKTKRSSKELNEETKEGADKITEKWELMKVAMNGVNSAIDMIDEAFGDMFSDVGKDAMGVVKTIAQATMNVLMAMSTTATASAEAVSTAEKSSVILTIISAALQVIMAITNAIIKNVSAHAQYQKAIEKSEKALTRMQEAEKSAEHSNKKAFGTKYWQGVGALARQAAQQVEEAERQVSLAYGQMAAARTKKQQKEAQENIDAANEALRQAEDNQRKYIESLVDEFTGTDLASFADSITDAIFSGFEDGLTDVKGLWTDTLDDMVLQMLKSRMSQELEKVFKPMFDKIEGYVSDGQLTDAEIRTISGLGETAYNDAQNIIDMYDNMYKSLGLDQLQQDAKSGAFQSMSQDTGDELNGRFTAVQMSSAAIVLKMDEVTTINRTIAEKLSSSFEQIALTVLIQTDILNEVREINATANRYLPSLSEITTKLDNIARKL